MNKNKIFAICSIMAFTSHSLIMVSYAVCNEIGWLHWNFGKYRRKYATQMNLPAGKWPKTYDTLHKDVVPGERKSII